MRKETGGPAFPESCGDQIIPGMTLRDWYAGQALEGFCQDPASDDATVEEIAHAAYRIADAMLAERSKK